MRPPALASLFAPLLAVVSIWACTPAPPIEAMPPAPEREDAPPPVAGRAGAFSAERAWADLEALAAIGPRPMGTPGSEAARHYIEEQLRAIGLEPKLQPAEVIFESEGGAEKTLVNVRATIPGESADQIVLVAPYDSATRDGVPEVGVNDGASGAALLLELARVIAAEPLRYTTELCFVDGDARLDVLPGDGGGVGLLGSQSIAEEYRQRKQLSRIRLLLYFNRVSDADLRIARDRASHRIHRDAIWQAAAALGYVEAFPRDAEFEAPLAGHRAFIDVGMRRTVAIIDSQLGTGDAADTLENSSLQSLRTVGRVILVALEDISARLAKIDRFAEAPDFEAATPAEPSPPVEPGSP